MSAKLLEQYQGLYSDYSAGQRLKRKKLNIIALLRLVTFVGGIYLSYQLITSNFWYGITLAAAVLALFIYLVVRFVKGKRQLALLSSLMGINAREIEALRGNVKNFDPGEEFRDVQHPFATDLEIFGEGGLFQHVNRTSTYAGKNQLATWLLSPLQREAKIRDRQSAVHELMPMVSWRQRFMAVGYQVSPEHYKDSQLIAWSKEQPSIAKNRYLKVFRWLLPALTLAALVLFILQILPVGYFLVLGAANLLVLRKASGRIKAQHQRVTRQMDTLRNYSRLFRHIEHQNFDSTPLNHLKQQFFADHQSASKAIQKLSHISDALDNRFNLLVGTLLNLLFLWDLHQVIRLENWHRHHAAHIEQWLDALGSFDAFISLAHFAHNHPDFNYPEISNSTVFEATGTGHPLIPPNKRVTNDLSIRQHGASLLITGANMAGKSTFLRTIGVNLVLAMAGTTVCARDMKFRITRLFTSMNITDSLTRNESYFYAEIKRLKQLTDHALKQGPLLVLLDEILTGTNTRDKEKASRAFVERLLQMKVNSIIATHDLSLTSLAQDHPGTLRNARFEVELENGRMKYDYKLRDGVAQNMNALDLLREMGLI